MRTKRPNKPFAVWFDNEPVFGPTSGHWGPGFDHEADGMAYLLSKVKRVRRGIVLRLYQGEREVTRVSN